MLAVLALGGPVAADDPLNTVRDFCLADGRGERLQPQSWARIAHLMAWPLEPAWDRVRLISGYEVGPLRLQGEEIEVEVKYTVTGEIAAGKVQPQATVEQRRLRLARDPASDRWRIAGPPPVPHLFASAIDAQATAAALAPDSDSYASSSVFVWQLLRSAGWDMPYLDLGSLAITALLSDTPSPMMGDLVFYYDGEEAYHVGFVESDDRVVSSTLNGGIRRTPLDAFPGAHRFRRLAGAPLPATPTVAANDGRPAALATPTSGQPPPS